MPKKRKHITSYQNSGCELLRTIPSCFSSEAYSQDCVGVCSVGEHGQNVYETKIKTTYQRHSQRSERFGMDFSKK
jgi:hypothetical protein